MAYLTHTDADRRDMLRVIGAPDVDALFASIPAGLRCKPLALPPALSEQELVAELTHLANRNHSLSSYDSFLGAGVYHRYRPAIVGATISRPEFYTAYTPYQAEASQGTLQTIFEFQSMIAELYGLDVANASLYDGPTAAAEAVLLAMGHTGRNRVLVSVDVHPEVRAVIHTFASAHELGVVETPWADMSVDKSVAAVVVGQPTFFGGVNDYGPLVEQAHASGALAIAYADPVACAVVTPPGAMGFDIAAGDGQQLGIPLSFGGPHVGLIAVRQALLRRIPGRLVGMTTDASGRRAFTLTLQAREQHIRREKATSNICTNHALMALAATVYMGYMGAGGLQAIADISTARAHTLAAKLEAQAGWELVDSDTPYLWEFAMRVGADADVIVERLRGDGIVAGLPLGQFDPPRADQILIACTEMTSIASIDRYAIAAEKHARAKVSA